MKKIAAIIATAGIVGFAGAALAHHKDGHDQGQGNAFGQGCFTAGDGLQKNPGHLFQAVTDRTGLSMQEIVEIVGQTEPDVQTLGDYIAARCGPDNLP